MVMHLTSPALNVDVFCLRPARVVCYPKQKRPLVTSVITRAGQLSYEGNGFDCLFPTINAPVRIQSQLEERAVLEFIMARYVYFNKIFSEYKSQGRLDVDDI